VPKTSVPKATATIVNPTPARTPSTPDAHIETGSDVSASATTAAGSRSVTGGATQRTRIVRIRMIGVIATLPPSRRHGVIGLPEGKRTERPGDNQQIQHRAPARDPRWRRHPAKRDAV
jgi:hypothetical protein